MFTRDPDDVEVRCAGDGHEAFTDRVDQAPVAADQSWDGHALDERASLDSRFEDVGDARIDPAEERLEAAEHPRLRRLTALAASPAAAVPLPSRPPTLRSSRWMRE